MHDLFFKAQKVPYPQQLGRQRLCCSKPQITGERHASVSAVSQMQLTCTFENTNEKIVPEFPCAFIVAWPATLLASSIRFLAGSLPRQEIAGLMVMHTGGDKNTHESIIAIGNPAGVY